jgi:putative membrane protein
VADTVIALGIAASALAYTRGVQRLWSATHGEHVIGRRQAFAFVAGVVALLVALVSPLEQAADRNLVWHMAQHVVLLTVVAPLLAVAAPLTALLYALPTRSRTRLQPWWRRLLRAQSGGAWFAWTAVAFVIATATLVAWHVPTLYDAALRSDVVHALEHVSFVGTAMFFWWMVLGAGRRSHRGIGVICVFAATLPATALGVLMTLASRPWYDAYGHGPGALRDQQLAGAVMWGFGGVALVAGAAALFASWLAGMERADERARSRVTIEPW